MKTVSLNGAEVAAFVKERHRAQLASLTVVPRLAIIVAERQADDTARYIRVKTRYASDLGIEVETVIATADTLPETIARYNRDSSVHGVIVQLPFLSDTLDSALQTIDEKKDVDALAHDRYASPTATAILWLLAAYGIDLAGKTIVVVGAGRLVGQPIIHELQSMSLEPLCIDETTADPASIARSANIIISGVGKPDIIKSDWLSPGVVVVDAGGASEAGTLKGDVEADARLRGDISVTPLQGGVGPLTVCALFDNLIRSAESSPR